MIEITTRIRRIEVEEGNKYCDICNSYIGKHPQLKCSIAKCQYCERDLCESCIGHESEHVDDSRQVWCKSCWSKGEGYRIEIEIFRDKIDEIYKDWEISCRENKLRL